MQARGPRRKSAGQKKKGHAYALVGRVLRIGGLLCMHVPVSLAERGVLHPGRNG